MNEGLKIYGFERVGGTRAHVDATSDWTHRDLPWRPVWCRSEYHRLIRAERRHNLALLFGALTPVLIWVVYIVAVNR